MLNFKPNILLLFLILCFGISHLSFAQDAEKAASLTKQVIEAKESESLYAPFEEIKEIYFKEHKYNEFIDFLKSLSGKNSQAEPFIDYYFALSRFYQLQFLEETQAWNEYFSKGDIYRDEVKSFAGKSLDTAVPGSLLSVYAKLLSWRFHNQQQDNSAASALADLIQGVKKISGDKFVLPNIKYIADQLNVHGEKPKAKELYNIYAEKLLGSGIQDAQIKSSAEAFFKEGNLELAEALYDAYVQRKINALEGEQLNAFLKDELVLIGLSFIGKDNTPADPAYAENIFLKIEAKAGREAFSEEAAYLRGLNLQAIKENPKARDVYRDLIERFPTGSYFERANYRLGMISTYILRDENTGRSYFETLAKKEVVSPQTVSALYQLGLLSQWQGDTLKAKEYYDKLIEKAADKFSDRVQMAKERQKEISEKQPIEYNLKTFLDLCLNKDAPPMDSSAMSLSSSPFQVKNGSEVNLKAALLSYESGCSPAELQYLWSGNLGKAFPTLNQPSFNTSFENSGSIEINLVVSGASGPVSCALDLVDVE